MIDAAGANFFSQGLEGVALEHGTPFYLYDLDHIRARAARVRGAILRRPDGPNFQLLYAVKANPNPGILIGLRGWVDGLDVASEGEVRLALRAGWPAAELHFAGPGKREEELRFAVERGVGVISVESLRELDALANLARGRGAPIRVALRLNPAQRIHAFAVPMTGTPSPFGIDVEELPALALRLERHQGLFDVEGLHVHAGGQCTSAEGFGAHVREALALALRLARDHGVRARSINFGGGFGVVPADGRGLDLARLGARFCEAYEELVRSESAPEAKLELGRYLVAESGIYVARVVSTKLSRGEKFIILDGGMNHDFAATGLLAPRAPRFAPVNLTRPDAPRARCTVVGPLCTPLDTLARGVELPEPEVGDLIGLPGSGAYGYTLSPLLFLGHPTPAELICEGGSIRCTRPRRTALDGL